MMSEWQDIASAPKDKHVLLFGKQSAIEELGEFTGPLSGYWDAIDSSWCATASTWRGPFIEATHWMPLPPPPQGDKP